MNSWILINIQNNMHPQGDSAPNIGRKRTHKRKGGEKMAYGIVHLFPDGTKEKYEAALAAVHPNRKTLTKGQFYYAAGPSAGGRTVIAIHDSKASWERFRDDILMPRLKQEVKGGFASLPQEQASEVYNLPP
jgi:hypothetical protein